MGRNPRPLILQPTRRGSGGRDIRMRAYSHNVNLSIQAPSATPVRPRSPSRAALSNLMARLDGHSSPVALLPAAVVGTLYNLAADGTVPGHQLAFHCFNYGNLEAMS